VSTIYESKEITINLLKNRSCDTCYEYKGNNKCRSTYRSTLKEGAWYYLPCPKERICEHYIEI